MKLFFDNLDDITYTIEDKENTIRNIFDVNLQYKKIEKYQDDPTYYFTHRISDGEKWESIAYKYYGDVNAFWILYFLNANEDIFYDFILTMPEIAASTSYSSQTNQITQELFDNTVTENDTKRVIKILKTEYVKDFENDIFGYKLIT